MSSAWPVPTATTLTPIPVAAVNFGSNWLNNPDCSVDVVDATVDFGTRRCVATGSVTFGHVPPNAVFFYFRNDMLVAWQISAHPRFRETLARSLMAQYGKPTVVYKGDHVTWRGRTCDLDFVGGAVQDTIVAVTKAELMTREAERRDRAHRAATRP